MATNRKWKNASKPAIAAGSAGQQKAKEVNSNPNLTQNHLKIISEIPQSYVWAFSAYIALVSIIAPIGQTPYGYNPDLYMAAMLQVGALGFLAIYLYLVYKNRSNGILIPRVPLLIYPVLAFYLWMVLSLFWAHNFYEAIVKVLDWGAAMIIFFLALMALRDRRSLFPMLFCIFCSLVLIALLSIGQYLFSVDWVAQHASPAATFGNKNMNGEFLVLTWALGLGLFMNSRNVAASWFYSIGTAAAIAALFYGRTRGSWLSFLVEVAVLTIMLIYLKYGLVHKYNWKLPKTIAALGFVVLTALLINTTPQFFVSTVPVIEKNTGGIDRKTNPSGGAMKADSAAEVVEQAKKGYAGTKNQRIIMWKNSLNMLKDYWLLGVGIGNWMVYYPNYQESYAIDPALRHGTLFHINAHNDYVEFICELGLVGMLLMLWVGGAVIFSLFRIFSKKSRLRQEDQVFGMVCFISIIGIAANAFVSFPLQQPITIAITMFYMGIFTAIVWNATDVNDRVFYRWVIPSPTLRIVASTATLTAAVAMFTLQTIWYKSDNLYFKAVSNHRSSNYKTAFEAAQESYKEFPIRKRTMYYIGNYYYRNQDYEKALPIFEEMREHYPYRRQTLNALSGVYLELGKTQEFEELMNDWKVGNSRSGSIHLTHAIAKVRQNKPKEAIAILEKAKNLPGNERTKSRIDAILQKLYRSMELAESERLKARLKAEKRARFLAQKRAKRAAKRKAN